MGRVAAESRGVVRRRFCIPIWPPVQSLDGAEARGGIRMPMVRRCWERDAEIVAWPGLHWILRAWHLRNVLIFRPLMWLRLWDVDLGELYVRGRPTWPWSRRNIDLWRRRRTRIV